MANIIRWNPLREMAAMQNAMDRLIDETWRTWQPVYGETGASALALDVHENDNEYIVTTALPGVQGDNINIKLHNELLTIEGEIPQHTIEDARSLMQERVYGRFNRTIRLPQPVNRDAVEANFENGVLTLHLPKAEEAQPRQIPVRVGSNGNKI
jgi:HSP20 family protein